MHEIMCPNYIKEFNLDETGYADILYQVYITIMHIVSLACPSFTCRWCSFLSYRKAVGWY